MPSNQSNSKGLTRRVQEQVEPLQLDIKQVTRTKSIFNENQIQKLFNSTPARHKFQRPAKGGGQWDYLKTGYVRRVLDSVFGFNWDFEVETSAAEAFEIAKLTKMVVVKGILTGRVWVDGELVTIRKVQFGRNEVQFKKVPVIVDGKTVYEDVTVNGKAVRRPKMEPGTEPLDFGNNLKAAGSDALKKCASLLGIGADVYDPEEFMAIEIIGSEESSERSKNLNKQIKNAKRAVRSAAKPVGKPNDSAKKDAAQDKAAKKGGTK